MSLADLKRQYKDAEQRPFTVDDFILDALNYAKGEGKLLRKKNEKALPPLFHQLALDIEHIDVKPMKEPNFRHCTFTLTEEIIAHLNELSEQTNIAKSRLIRILITSCKGQDNLTMLQRSMVE
ncbi:ribbon-helix-helix domain-containing protein [Thalassotalea aquiviva]|uniref:ribbon-helix-helix domain-containing protein n=1 Tax=Thalassotalea aquiviva TaxID=3242415 RepID=UPI003529F694